MNNQFSIKRIGLLLRTDFIMYKKSLLLYGCGIIAVLIFWMWSKPADKENTIFIQLFTYSILYFTAFALYCKYVQKKINLTPSQYFMVPASNAEKFTSLLLELFIINLFIIGLFYISMLLWWILIHHPVQGLTPSFSEFRIGDLAIVNIFNNPGNHPYLYTINTFLGVIMTLYMLGMFTFKRWAAPITLCIILGVGILLIYVFQDFISYVTYPVSPSIFVSFSSNSIIYKNHYTGLLKFIVEYKTYVYSLICIWLIYIMYLKFTEKEQR